MASFKVNGDGTTTVTLDYTADTENVQATVEAAAHRLYTRTPPVDGDGEPILWDSLNNQDKLNIVSKFVRTTVVELAREDLHITRTAERDALRAADNATLMEPE